MFEHEQYRHLGLANSRNPIIQPQVKRWSSSRETGIERETEIKRYQTDALSSLSALPLMTKFFDLSPIFNVIISFRNKKQNKQQVPSYFNFIQSSSFGKDLNPKLEYRGLGQQMTDASSPALSVAPSDVRSIETLALISLGFKFAFRSAWRMLKTNVSGGQDKFLHSVTTQMMHGTTSSTQTPTMVAGTTTYMNDSGV